MRIDDSYQNVIFFDDVCVLCNGTVLRLIKRDKKKILRYSALQGKLAQSLKDSGRLKAHESVVFWSDGEFKDRARAVIAILIKLGGMYRFIGYGLKVIPIFILNTLYELVARHRYRLFGKNEVCLMPTNDIKELFIP